MTQYYVYDADYPMTDDDCGDLGQVDAIDMDDAKQQAAIIWPNTNLYIADIT